MFSKDAGKWKAAGLSSLKSVGGAASSLSSSVVTGLRAGLDSLKNSEASDKQTVTFVRFANLEYVSQVGCRAGTELDCSYLCKCARSACR